MIQLSHELKMASMSYLENKYLCTSVQQEQEGLAKRTNSSLSCSS